MEWGKGLTSLTTSCLFEVCVADGWFGCHCWCRVSLWLAYVGRLYLLSAPLLPLFAFGHGPVAASFCCFLAFFVVAIPAPVVWMVFMFGDFRVAGAGSASSEVRLVCAPGSGNVQDGVSPCFVVGVGCSVGGSASWC